MLNGNGQSVARIANGKFFLVPTVHVRVYVVRIPPEAHFF